MRSVECSMETALRSETPLRGCQMLWNVDASVPPVMMPQASSSAACGESPKGQLGGRAEVL